MENLYTTNILDYRYHLLPEDFGGDPDDIFLAKLKKEIEGKISPITSDLIFSLSSNIPIF